MMRIRRGCLPLAVLAISFGLAQVSLAEGEPRRKGADRAARMAPKGTDNEDWLKPPPGAARETWDPIEPANRGVFTFNDTLDVYALAPIARGWKAVTPRAVRRSVSHFFVNLGFPLRFLGCLTQGRVTDTAEELGRFAVNTSVGIAGLFDPATRIGLELNRADLGQSLGRAGVGAGPYLVLPLLGPSTTRDLINLPFEALGTGLVPGLGVVKAVNSRAEMSEDIRQAKEASLDYYAFVRNAYVQQRDALMDERKLREAEIAASQGEQLSGAR